MNSPLHSRNLGLHTLNTIVVALLPFRVEQRQELPRVPQVLRGLRAVAALPERALRHCARHALRLVRHALYRYSGQMQGEPIIQNIATNKIKK